MTIQELGTIYQNNTAVKIIILNNNFSRHGKTMATAIFLKKDMLQLR